MAILPFTDNGSVLVFHSWQDRALVVAMVDTSGVHNFAATLLQIRAQCEPSFQHEISNLCSTLMFAV